MSFFLALDLDEVVRAEVVRAIERHRAEVTAKWLRADKLHLTLRFLGHPAPETLALLEPSVRAIARTTAPFTLSLQGGGFFVTARASNAAHLAHTGGALETLEPALRDFTSSPFTASHLTLYESTHLHYRAVQRFDFEGQRKPRARVKLRTP